jgi:putative Mn2+ efflux pump MntP
MTNLQVALMAFAISLDSLGLMIVEGAMAPEVQYKELLKVSLFVGGWQTLAFLIGNSIYPFVLSTGVPVHRVIPLTTLRILAFIIFIGLGAIMLRRGFKLEYIDERRQPFIQAKKIIMITIISCIDALLAGIGLSFAQIEITSQFYIILIISFLSVIAGVYIGYWFGYEEKPNAYRLSSIIYFVMGVSIVV